MLSRVVVPALCITCIIFVPIAACILAALNFVAALAIHTLHLVFAHNSCDPMPPHKPRGRVKDMRRPSEPPFVSIHVPTHAEPVEVVRSTLMALSRQRYKKYEVIVLDNNTADIELYEPIRKLCAELGPTFRFYHYDGVTGGKSGALNIALTLADPRAEFIAIVDADYVVDDRFIEIAIDSLHNPEIGFVQFPQAYRNIDPHAVPIARELDDYFAAFALRANETHSMLLTGTLSVIRCNILKACGGWSSQSITEDAELGLRLVSQGIKGVFVDMIVGEGLLPLSLEGLKVQRHRWVAGNTQVLSAYLWARPGRLFDLRDAAVLAQLTAWPSFWFIPAIILFTSMLWLPVPEPFSATAIELSAATIVSSFLLIAVRLLIVARSRRQPFKVVITSLTVKLAMVLTSSTAWIDGLMSRQLRFFRTPKSLSPNSRSGDIATCLVFLFSISAAVYYAINTDLWATTACLLLASSWPASLWVSTTLSKYATSLNQGVNE